MGQNDQAHGGKRRRRYVLAAAGLVVAVLAVVLVTLQVSLRSTGPPVGASPTTSGPVTEPVEPTDSLPQASQPPPSTRPTAPPSTRPTQGESSEPPTSREEYERAAKRELEEGLVAYNPPAQARVQEDFELTVRVQRGTATVSPSLTALPGTPQVTTEKLPVGTYMRADLRGAGFDVESLSDELQLVDGVTEWAWRVTPQDDGLKTLRLTLVVVLDDLPLSNRTFDRSINVDVKKQPPWYHRAWGLLDVSGVITAIVIAAILGSAKVGRTKWIRRQAAEAEADDRATAEPPDTLQPTTPATPQPVSTPAEEDLASAAHPTPPNGDKQNP
jgi:hypothetical protein